ncbi:DNA polymerase III alpha subunit [Breoghania corrubedonensis]|uniref:DNA polymerase III subunit alpha n=1 Tax=Breoghania corrubedonensis TaxID=665038 RepID=A0A2T5VBK4_9HYPH|nr:DNA polymerase III subunit alpha [Breoghania corrubedonensis]PTW61135.1 DNA polymerase III alpha subunit [Breoghania corrubedonensis]
MADVGFVHLRVHSAFSLLEGALPVAKLIKLAQADAQPALAITDTGNLFGALEFSEKAVGAGIQPIIGCQLAVDWGGEASARKSADAYPECVLLAADDEGFARLVELVSHSFIDTEPGLRPHVPADLLASHSGGLVALTGGVNGPIGRAILAGQEDVARARLQRMKAMFGDRLYVELQRHGMTEERQCEGLLVDYAYEESLPLVATNEPFFPTADDYEAHDALICISEGRVIIEDDRRHLSPEHYFKSRADMLELFADLPEATENTVEIARRCHVRVPKRPPLLPRFAGADADPEEAEKAEAEELARQAREGLERRLAAHGLAPGHEHKDYEDRLDFELNIITSMKFPGYFLIVADFIKWAKGHGIPVGPGRGSGAGSLVAWSLTITDLDPIRFNLLFERFLNPERVSMPDFDIDFCQDRREEVIRYVQGKYGRGQVAQIITFGTLQARVVLRDVGRVLQMPYGQVDRLCKLVPQNPANPVTLKQAIEEEPRLQQAAQEEEIVNKLLTIGQKLEGLYRHASTHAAGVVIGDRPLEQLVPLYRDPRSDMPVTQFNMKWVEKTGLIKFDFLGLKTLTVLSTGVKLVARRGVDVDLSTIPLDDPPTYKLLTNGETVGVFQLESAGMRRAIAGMKPDRFEDIIALVALYRPGPMDNIPTYNRRKHGEEEPDFLHPKLEPILKETHGIIIYQEQVMQLAQILAGYSLGDADLLRRAMGKKIAAEMEVQRSRFVEGAAKNSVPAAQAKTIFDLVAKFANYGFNKSHAAAYALVAYQTAWMKANHPVEFLAALMTLDIGNTDKLNDFRREAQRMDIEVVSPDINRSCHYFDVQDGAIIYSLAAIKGVGSHVVEHIEDVRTAGGPFRDIGDFARRISPKQMNKRTLESLIAAGTFDCLDPDRAKLMAGIDRIVGEAQRAEENATSGQGDIFGMGAPEPLRLSRVEAWLPEEKLAREHAAVGFYLSAHPLDEYRGVLDRMRVQMWASFEASVKRGAAAGRLAGTITAKQERKTKTGNKMGIVRVSDPTGQYEAVLFSEGLAQFRDLLEVGRSVVLIVAAEVKEEGIGVRIQSVEPLEVVANRIHKSLKIFLRDGTPVANLKRYLSHRGDSDISIVCLLEGGAREVEVQLPGRYQISPQVASALKAVKGVVQVEMA